MVNAHIVKVKLSIYLMGTLSISCQKIKVLAQIYMLHGAI